MAACVRGAVVWPTEVRLPATMREVYPKTFPPLRTDGDAIAIGVLQGDEPQQIAMQAELDGKPIELAWTVQPEKPNPDFNFLPQLVDLARNDGGVSLPTAGSAALREAGRIITASAQDLAQL